MSDGISSAPIQLPLTTDVNGRTWRLFDVEWTGADGHFSFYIYAISAEHAGHIVDEIKETAKLGGEIVGHVKG